MTVQRVRPPANPAARRDPSKADGDPQNLQIVQFVDPGFEYHRTEHVGPRLQASGVMAWKSDKHTFALAGSVAVVLATVLYIHLGQKHGRKIAGYVDLLRPKDKP